MRRSFEELKPLWDVLSMQTFPGGDFSDEKAAIIAKWSNIVMERLYPAYSSDYTYVLNEYGEISNGEYSVSECADMGIYSHMAWSETAAMCSYYLEKSPHWNYYIRVIEAGVVEPDEEEEGF